MISYTIPTDLLEAMGALNNALATHYAKLQSMQPGTLSSMHRYAYISMIGASTRIENALLTDAEVDWIDTVLTQDAHIGSFNRNKSLIEDKLSKDRERSIEEVAGCRSMLQIIYTQAAELIPLRETMICGLHDELMKYYPKADHFRGRYKHVSNSVIERDNLSGRERIVFQTADPGPITSAAMHELIKWYNEAMTDEPRTIALAVEFVYRFLAIHPFQDGNGRLGRGLFLLVLLQSKDIVIRTLAPYLAIDRQVEKHRAEYYLVLNQCSQGKFKQNPSDYDIEHFLRFMLKMLHLSLEDIQHYQSKTEALTALPPSAQQVLDCFKEHPEIRLTTQKIMMMTGVPRRTVTNALSRLIDDSLIQRLGRGRGTRYQLQF